ncbi:MAG: hypothetical protein ACD_9C00127G0003 [uncultured bacterium]|nr:MAG: hypothetical protein ACD_9C00127G0003 [uncultured bacterium]
MQYTRSMQSKKLGEISGLIAGYTFRGALKSESQGSNQVILAKHINDDGSINYSDLIQISQELPRTNAFVSKNDVLLSSRGVFRAGVFEKDEDNVIAASSMFILRIKKDNITPEYLAIYLNSEAGQNSIQKILTGSTIKTILRRTLANLKIPIPPLPAQKQIVEIIENWRKRERLLSKKMSLSKNIANGAIQKILTI